MAAALFTVRFEVVLLVFEKAEDARRCCFRERNESVPFFASSGANGEINPVVLRSCVLGWRVCND